MTITEIQNNAKTKMEKTKDVLRSDLMAIRAGRANPQLLDRITVDYYGTPTPLKNVANISAPEPRILQINPWDAKMVKDISRAIQASDLGLTPSNDGKVIRLMLPELTEERRKLLVKQIRQEAEQHAERDRDRLSAFRRLQKRPCVSGHRGEQNQGENPGTHRNSGTVRRQKHRQKSLPDIAQDAEQSNPQSSH